MVWTEFRALWKCTWSRGMVREGCHRDYTNSEWSMAKDRPRVQQVCFTDRPMDFSCSTVHLIKMRIQNQYRYQPPRLSNQQIDHRSAKCDHIFQVVLRNVIQRPIRTTITDPLCLFNWSNLSFFSFLLRPSISIFINSFTFLHLEL